MRLGIIRLSIAVLAALGCVIALFRWGWDGSPLGVETTGPIMSLILIFLLGIVFSLAINYEVAGHRSWTSAGSREQSQPVRRLVLGSVRVQADGSRVFLSASSGLSFVDTPAFRPGRKRSSCGAGQGEAGSPPGRTGVRRPPADTRRSYRG
ncbi:hypothetical protein [Streptomyces canus]|uniref:hypothetical protein n=1 Tax=Streptomyces canus TaxID=58343 RepID=UPI0033A2474B